MKKKQKHLTLFYMHFWFVYFSSENHLRITVNGEWGIRLFQYLKNTCAGWTNDLQWNITYSETRVSQGSNKIHEDFWCLTRSWPFPLSVHKLYSVLHTWSTVDHATHQVHTQCLAVTPCSPLARGNLNCAAPSLYVHWLSHKCFRLYITLRYITSDILDESRF